MAKLAEIRKKLFLTATIGLGMVIALVTVLMLPPVSPPVESLPSPNGYDDLIRAAGMLTPKPSLPENSDTAAFESLVAENADVLRLAREGLQKECIVALNLTTLTNQMLTNIGNHLTEISHFKALAGAFIAEGKLAERNNHHAEAARVYLETIRLGHECCRGGIIIDLLVGLSAEAMGCRALEAVSNHLQVEDGQATIHQLEKITSKAEPVDKVVERDRIWSRRWWGAQFGWRGGLFALMQRKSLRAAELKAVAKFQAQQNVSRSLLIHLAARSYKLEKGSPPKTVADLVPTYLRAIPRDAVTGKDLIDLP